MSLCKFVAVLALLAAAMADVLDREMYDDTPGDLELMYPELSYVDTQSGPEVGTEPRPTVLPRKYNDNVRKMLLSKMLTALRNHDASPTFLSVPKWIPTETVLVPPDTFNYSPLKGALGPMFKRSEGNLQSSKPQQKWKLKQGKSGYAMLCYFKLCAYRPSI